MHKIIKALAALIPATAFALATFGPNTADGARCSDKSCDGKSQRACLCEFYSCLCAQFPRGHALHDRMACESAARYCGNSAVSSWGSGADRPDDKISKCQSRCLEASAVQAKHCTKLADAERAVCREASRKATAACFDSCQSQ